MLVYLLSILEVVGPVLVRSGSFVEDGFLAAMIDTMKCDMTPVITVVTLGMILAQLIGRFPVSEPPVSN